VEADAVLGPERVRAGDVVIAMASSGLHSNGYSLVRRVIDRAGLDLTATPPGLVRPLGDELLEPTRIYARDCLALVEELGVESVHAYAHITGGGLAGNTVRVVPAGLAAVLDRSTWALPAVVRLLEEHGVPRAESERAFNCGVGMVAAVAPEQADRAVALLTTRGVPAWVAGSIAATDGEASARLVSSYR
jgi:phosphoribosylformylglycinamidine cyclo-ligase